MARKTIEQRLAELDAQRATLKARLSKQERANDTRRKVLLGALVLHRLEHGRDEISRALPDWLRRGLKYAPLAALAAVIAPELVMSQGALIKTLADARLPAVLCASAYYFWRRGILGTIVVGMAVYLPLHIGLGW